jgi:hypothetical protein
VGPTFTPALQRGDSPRPNGKISLLPLDILQHSTWLAMQRVSRVIFLAKLIIV